MTPERPWAKVTPNFGATLSTEKTKIYAGNKTAKIFLSLLNHHESMVNSYTDYKISVRLSEIKVIDTNITNLGQSNPTLR